MAEGSDERASQDALQSQPAHSAEEHSGRGLFQCGDCFRKYTRLDHLARHVRSRVQVPTT